MAEKEQYVVEGFAFSDVDQAKAASIEYKRIEMLNKSMDFNNLSSVAMVYEKARDNSVFKTPLGICYMKQLYDYLVSKDYEGIEGKTIPITPVEMANNASSMEEERKRLEQREEILKSRISAQKEKEKEQGGRYKISVACNVFLIFLILVMFTISLTGKTPTVLNYKSKIINQYTQWQQDLEEREEAIKEKEAELGITNP